MARRPVAGIDAHALGSEDALLDLDGVARLQQEVGHLAVGDVVDADGGRHRLLPGPRGA